MIIQQIRNATLKIKYGGITFLIDPWFQDKGTGFSVKNVRKEMEGIKCPMNDLPDMPENIIKDADYCLVTHLHFDHFSSDYLPKDLKIIAQDKTDMKKIEEMGFEYVSCFESDRHVIEDIVIHKTKAIHGNNAEVVEKMGDVCGYIFESANEKTLYIAADTVYCQEVSDYIDEYQPNAIVLNCCEASLPIGRLIMNLSDIKEVCMKAPDAMIIASHLDSVNHALLSSDDVRNFVKKEGLKQVCVPHNGDFITI